MCDWVIYLECDLVQPAYWNSVAVRFDIEMHNSQHHESIISMRRRMCGVLFKSVDLVDHSSVGHIWKCIAVFVTKQICPIKTIKLTNPVGTHVPWSQNLYYHTRQGLTKRYQLTAVYLCSILRRHLNSPHASTIMVIKNRLCDIIWQ